MAAPVRCTYCGARIAESSMSAPCPRCSQTAAEDEARTAEHTITLTSETVQVRVPGERRRSRPGGKKGKQRAALRIDGTTGPLVPRNISDWRDWIRKHPFLAALAGAMFLALLLVLWRLG